MGQPARPLEFTVPKEQANKSSSLLIVESVWIAANNRQKTELKSYNGSCMALTIKSGFWKRFYDANIKKSAYFDGFSWDDMLKEKVFPPYIPKAFKKQDASKTLIM